MKSAGHLSQPTPLKLALSLLPPGTRCLQGAWQRRHSFHERKRESMPIVSGAPAANDADVVVGQGIGRSGLSRVFAPVRVDRTKNAHAVNMDGDGAFPGTKNGLVFGAGARARRSDRRKRAPDSIRFSQATRRWSIRHCRLRPGPFVIDKSACISRTASAVSGDGCGDRQERRERTILVGTKSFYS